MNATIEATLTANTAGFTAGLNNASASVSKLEQQMRRAGALPLPGERSARDSADVFARQAEGADKVTAARYRGMESATREESAIRSAIRAREDEAAAALASSNKLAAAANIRANRDLERSFAQPAATARTATVAGGAAPAGLPVDDGSFTALRKRFLATAGGLGAGELIKGAGIGALVAGFRAALNNAQELRKQSRELGTDLDPAVAATARLGDGFDRLKQVGFSIINQVSQVVVDGIDGVVAGAGALLGLGSISENLDAINRDPEAERARVAKKRAEDQAIALAAAKTEVEYQNALAELEAARVDSLKEGLDTQQKIALAEEQIKLTKQEIARIGIADARSDDPKERALAAAQELEAAKKTKQLTEEETDLARLRKDREAEIADEKQRALEIQQRGEAAITAEKEKQFAKEQQIARAREQAAQRVAAAEEKVATTRAAYAAALSDQSAASLSEIQSGQRGSPEDRRKAAEVARLRARAAQARDRGSLAVIGGETVSVADQLSTRANQVQSSVASLNTSERNPLGGVEAALAQANDELSQIRESLAIMELE